ncbi:MAG: SRPBCC family protein [Pseudomonadota bacterium]|nr:SRPBCC family protein [Pseudomonadota bacterium]
MKNLKRIIFILFIINFNINSSNAHGPSRQKVSESIEINASSDDVWKVISNFSVFNWNKNIEKITAKSNEVGSERLIEFKSGHKVKQKLEKIDNSKKIISWRITETDNKVLPVNSYAAKIFVKSKDNITTVLYKTGFYRGFMGNNPPPELNDENSKKLVKSFVSENLKGLKKIVEKN